MKNDIHPEYSTKVKVTCACGNSFTTGSTAKEIKIELCSKCHPFYTGKQKLVDTAGRVDKFKEKLAKQEVASKTRRGKKEKRAELAKKRAEKKPKADPAVAKKVVKKEKPVGNIDESKAKKDAK